MIPTIRLLMFCLAIGLLMPGNLIAQDGKIEQTVNPGKMGRWTIKTVNGAAAEFVEGPETSLKGKGSLKVMTGPGDGPDKGGKIYIGNDAWNERVLSDIQEISFSFYVETANSAAVAPYLNIHLDYNLNGKWDGVEGGDMILVFDPTLQPPPAGNHTIPPKTWKTGLHESELHIATHNNGGWWIVGHEDKAGRRGNSKNLAQVMASFPTRQMIPNTKEGVPAVVLVVGAKDGGTFANFEGYIDNITMQGSYRKPHTYDFEFAAPPPPEPVKSTETSAPAPKETNLDATQSVSATTASRSDEEEDFPDDMNSYHRDSDSNPVLIASVSVSLLGGVIWLVYLIVQVVRCKRTLG